MRGFRELSLRRKLVLVILAASTAAVVLTATALVLVGWVLARQRLIERIEAHADLLAANSAPALVFDDAKSAGETLGSLRVATEVVQAWLYRPDGTVFAGYDRGQVWPIPVPREGHQFVRGHLLVFVPVEFGGAVVGRLGVRADASAYRQRVFMQVALAGVVILLALALAFWLAARLSDMVVGPVHSLTRATDSVVADGDYSLRVVRETGDEIGQLVDGFNAMLGVIQQRKAELRASEERFRSAFEDAPGGMALGTLAGRFVRVNGAFCAFLGCRAEELLQSSLSELVAPATREAVSAQWQALASGELPVYDVEQQFLRRDGRWVWGRMAATVLRDGTGGSQFILLQVQDITDRKQAQQELQERQTHLRALLDAVPDLMFRIQSDGVILDYHAHDPSLLYRPAGELIGARYTELLPPEAVRNIGEALKKAVATGRLQRAEYSLPVPAGMRDFEARFMRSGAQEAIVIVRDITERRRLDRQLLEVGEHERRRIGQDLHDGVCQQLVGIGFMVRLLEQQLQAAQSPAAAAVHGIAGHLHDAIRDAREVSHGLHPVRLDEEGLALALRELAAQVSRTGEVSCEFEYPEPVPVADNNAATHLYRIAQEAVNNALKHGKPRHITIALTGENETTELRIEDDGVGFGAAPDPTAKGIGLQVMEYRARLIGGILNLGPRPKGGTVVTCSWGGR